MNNAYVECDSDAWSAQEKIIQRAKEFGLKSFQDGFVQVLAPMKKGPVGVIQLNYELQKALNSDANKSEVIIGSFDIKRKDGGTEVCFSKFREGDSVIHIKNNYQQPWFEKTKYGLFQENGKSGVVNGDTGVIEAIRVSKDDKQKTHTTLYVKYDDHYIAYVDDFEELTLAYAMTIHKSQGSQWPVVLCPLAQWSILLNRKLIYTMYTRASETNVLIGNPNYVSRAIADNREDGRITLLKNRF